MLDWLKGITLGEIFMVVSWIVGGFGAIAGLSRYIGKGWKKALQSELAPLNQKMDDLTKDTRRVEIDACRNFLTRFLADVEQGHPVSEIEKQRFHEVYSRYTSPDLHGNSYIHSKYEELKKAGKL